MKQTLMMFLQKGKIILIKDLDKKKIVGITIFMMNEYLWSKEQLCISSSNLYIKRISIIKFI